MPTRELLPCNLGPGLVAEQLTHAVTGVVGVVGVQNNITYAVDDTTTAGM